MNKFKLQNLIPLYFLIALSFSSCQVIGGIFKAGVWFGIIGVIILVVIIFWLISKVGKK